MMYVYILKSKILFRYYVGSTQDVVNRLKEHNSGECRSTRHGIPWNVVHIEEFGTRGAAMVQEQRIKSRGIARYLESVNRD
jgi:putative endonuclease